MLKDLPLYPPVSPHRSYSYDQIHNKLVRSTAVRVSPSKMGFIVSVHNIEYRHPVDPRTSYTVVLRGVADLYP